MRKRILYTSLIMILLVSVVAFSEIIETGDWDGHDSTGGWTYSTVTAHASGSNEDDTSVGYGWQYIYTTVVDDLDWSTYVYVWAEVKMYIYNNESCSGLADASASATNPFVTDSVSALVSFSYSGEEGPYKEEYDGVYTITNSWYKEFDVYEGLSCEHGAYAGASIPNGGDSWVHSHADAVAQGSLSD